MVVGLSSTPVQLNVRAGDRIEIHLTKPFYDYTCGDFRGDQGVLTAETSSSDGNATVDAAYSSPGSATRYSLATVTFSAA